MSHIHVSETVSTNTLLRQMLDRGDLLGSLSYITADFQTAGRGQVGNHWESERGKNLLLSALYVPQTHLDVSCQFYISMAVSLAVCDTLRPLLGEYAKALKIKWPNDIYVSDQKIAGILIENRLSGRFIADCIVGLGLNVNQDVFRSDAPNPVSVWQLTNADNDTDSVAKDFMSALSLRLSQVDAADFSRLLTDYCSLLYRADGRCYPFVDADGRFDAQIVSVAPDGRLTLERTNGVRNAYLFKEVEFII